MPNISNDLAYKNSEVNFSQNFFIGLSPEAYCIKLFAAVFKATALQASSFVLVGYFHPNLIFGGKAWSLPFDWNPVRISSRLACKY